MNKITKEQLIEARAAVTNAQNTVDAARAQNIYGLSNAEMVEIELRSIHYANVYAERLREYQDLLHRYYAQENGAVKEQAAS